MTVPDQGLPDDRDVHAANIPLRRRKHRFAIRRQSGIAALW
jgi:hypothetical protein